MAVVVNRGRFTTGRVHESGPSIVRLPNCYS